ncbi:MAG: hypothetical protein AAF975_05855, partial [Spirochaetota bacterium]
MSMDLQAGKEISSRRQAAYSRVRYHEISLGMGYIPPASIGLFMVNFSFDALRYDQLSLGLHGNIALGISIPPETLPNRKMSQPG